MCDTSDLYKQPIMILLYQFIESFILIFLFLIRR